MLEKTPDSANPKAEKIPSEREVMEIIYDYIKNHLEGKPFKEVLRNEDADGQLYRLILELTDVDGCAIHLDYTRVGDFPERRSLETTIDIIRFDDGGIPVSGQCLANYEGATWNLEY